MSSLKENPTIEDTGSSSKSLPSLSSLPSEILLHIFSYLDIPDLLSLSRTMHYLRTISIDPLLHAHRLQRVSGILSRAIPSRPPLTELMARRVYITRTTLAALNLGRNLTMIKLKRQLERRPSVERLIELGVLPAEYSLSRTYSVGATFNHYLRKKLVQKERAKNLLEEWIGELSKRGFVRKNDSV